MKIHNIFSQTKYLLFSLVIISFLSSSCFATHNKGGTIGYKRISNLEYEITVIMYVDTEGVDPEDSVEVRFGDGTSELVPLLLNIEFIANHIGRVTYKVKHQFPAFGWYAISLVSENRNNDILNISPGESNSPPLYLESTLYIDSNTPNDHELSPFAGPLVFSKLGEQFRFNANIKYKGNGTLTHKLVSCMSAQDTIVSGYYIPEGAFIDQYTGDFFWPNPENEGEYAFAIKSTVWENGYERGSIIRDFQVFILDLEDQGAWTINGVPLSEYGSFVFEFQENDTLSYDIEFSTPEGYVSLELFGDSVLVNNPELFSLNYQEPNTSFSATLSWPNSILPERTTPYLLTIRAFASSPRDISFTFYPGEKPVLVASEGPIALTMRVFPNPSENVVNFEFGSMELLQDYSLTIYDNLGKVVFQRNKLDAGVVEFDASEQPFGIYIYVLRKNDIPMQSGKLILE